jgi:hypothetical protein
MKTKPIILIFLFALFGQFAHAQGPNSPYPWGTPFAASAASPSPSANALSVFEFTIPSYPIWEGMPLTSSGPFLPVPFGAYTSFNFVTSSASGGEVADFGLYSISGSTATLFRSTGATSLADTGLAAQLTPFASPTDPNFHSGTSYLFAMCSSSTSATITPYLQQGGEIWAVWVAAENPLVAASTYVSGASGYVSASSFGGEIFRDPWSSDPNWGTDATDVCTNGVLPNTITLANVTPN